MVDSFNALLDWVGNHPDWAGWVVFAISLSESLAIVGMLVPGVVLILGIGALAQASGLEFWPLCLWAFSGAVIGDVLSFWLGQIFHDRLHLIWPFTRHPHWLRQGEHFFERYGGLSVAFARFVGPGRATVPLIAGAMHMPWSHFLVANVGSAAAWAPAYLGAGVLLGVAGAHAEDLGWRLGLVVFGFVIAAGLIGAALRPLLLHVTAPTWQHDPWHQKLQRSPLHGALVIGTVALTIIAAGWWLLDPSLPDRLLGLLGA